jgi:uncharacterized protein YfaP (DUF2135 family)
VFVYVQNTTKMRLVVLFLVVMVVTSSCLAVPMRGMLGGTYGQELEGSKEESKAEYPDSSINNHHNIPRQNFNDGTSQGANGGSNDDGSG